MKLDPIIISLLDSDLYKFNMNQVMFHKHTDLCGEYYFKNRTAGVSFTPEMFKEINEQIDHLCTLRFTEDELNYLRSIRFIKKDYVEFLRLWHPIRDYVQTSLDNGLWYNTDNKLVWGIGRLKNCKTKYLPMGYDKRYHQGGKNWFSSCSHKKDLKHWYSLKDAVELVKNGFVFTRYLAVDYHEYENETVF